MQPMYYFKPCTVSKDTAVDDPLQFILPIAQGIIESIDIEFPAGCCGLVGIRVINEDWQLVPWNTDQWLSSDDGTFTLPLNYSVDQPPYRLVIYAYNLDDVYSHTIRIGVMLNEKKSSNLGLAIMEGL